MEDEDFFSAAVKEYTGAEDQIGSTSPYVNMQSGRITMGQPDKNGLVALSVVKGNAQADFLSQGRQDQARLYAGVRMLDRKPTRAMEIIQGVNKNLAEAIANDSGL